MTTKRKPGRPRLGSTEPVLLKLSPAQLTAVTEAAAAAGLPRVEWLRRAAAYCVAIKAPLTHVTAS